MIESSEPMSIRDAVGLYLTNLKPKDSQPHTQQELFRFVHWCGPDRTLPQLGPSEIEHYVEQAGGSGTAPQAAERLRAVKNFLTFARKKGFIEDNLAQHVRIRKSKSKFGRSRESDRDLIKLTPEGHAELVLQVDKLRKERGPLAKDIGIAAADKDVRENVPLEAAREQLGLLESRIREIENTLNNAVVIDPSRPASGQTIRVGSKVSLQEIEKGHEISYLVVSVWEANPLEGKISDVSPVGKALLRRSAGQEVEVETPRGKMRYRILKVSP